MALINRTIVMWLVLFSCPGLGVPAEEAKTSTATFSGPQVVANLVDPAEKVFVWRDVRIQLTIINGNSPIGIESLSIAIPRRTGWETNKNGNLESCGDCVIVPMQAFDFKTPGEKRDLGNVYVRPANWNTLRDEFFSFLLYRPRKEVFLVNLKYKPLADASGSPRILSTRLDVNVSAHPLGMYIGAILGVVLATALVWCYRATKVGSSGQTTQGLSALPTENQPPQGSAQVASNFASPWWLRLIRGSVASLVAILLFQTTSDISFPISVTVHDFYGGVLLGLFGDKVTEAIWAKI